MTAYFKELEQREIVEIAKQLYQVGLRREWQLNDEYVKDTLVTYIQDRRAEIYRYQGEFMEAETCYFLPTLEDILAFLIKQDLIPTLEYFAKGKWRLTWQIGGFAEGLTPRLAALRSMETLLRATQTT
jgi:hypothetical protein